jgi:hypothetical protein
MIGALDFYARDGGTLETAEQNSPERITDCGPESTFKRLDGKPAVRWSRNVLIVNNPCW